MYRNSKITAIIVAAGSGKRFGSDIPKQFLKLNGKSILEHGVSAFCETDEVDDIVIVVHEDFMDYAKDLLRDYPKIRAVVAGGKERQDSVLNGLGTVKDGIVLIHDGARPYVTGDLILRVIEETFNSGACVPGVPVKDTVRTSEGTLDRSRLFSVQTPQGFLLHNIMAGITKAKEEGFVGTDDGSLVERLGIRVGIVPGDYANIKITTREDLKTMEVRTGTGYDVHKLVEGRKCILLGVDIPNETGLLGHSDADVATHALMDAMLGAAALGDIGRIFPDNDPQYEGISSIKLLKDVTSRVRAKGYEISNCDITIICQKPRIAPYISGMTQIISDAMGVAPDRINIKGTTTEGLGFAGRKEGIEATAVCTLVR